jgi:hypothetical protein
MPEQNTSRVIDIKDAPFPIQQAVCNLHDVVVALRGAGATAEIIGFLKQNTGLAFAAVERLSAVRELDVCENTINAVIAAK